MRFVASALAQACCAWARYAVLRGSGGASKLARHGVAVVFAWRLRLRRPALYGCVALGREALGREHPEGMTSSHATGGYAGALVRADLAG